MKNSENMKTMLYNLVLDEEYIRKQEESTGLQNKKLELLELAMDIALTEVDVDLIPLFQFIIAYFNRKQNLRNQSLLAFIETQPAEKIDYERLFWYASLYPPDYRLLCFLIWLDYLVEQKRTKDAQLLINRVVEIDLPMIQDHVMPFVHYFTVNLLFLGVENVYSLLEKMLPPIILSELLLFLMEDINVSLSDKEWMISKYHSFIEQMADVEENMNMTKNLLNYLASEFPSHPLLSSLVDKIRNECDHIIEESATPPKLLISLAIVETKINSATENAIRLVESIMELALENYDYYLFGETCLFYKNELHDDDLSLRFLRIIEDIYCSDTSGVFEWEKDTVIQGWIAILPQSEQKRILEILYDKCASSYNFYHRDFIALMEAARLSIELFNQIDLALQYIKLVENSISHIWKSEEKIDILLALANFYKDKCKNNDRYRDYFELAIEVADELEDKYEAAEAFGVIAAFIYNGLGESEDIKRLVVELFTKVSMTSEEVSPEIVFKDRLEVFARIPRDQSTVILQDLFYDIDQYDFLIDIAIDRLLPILKGEESALTQLVTLILSKELSDQQFIRLVEKVKPFSMENLYLEKLMDYAYMYANEQYPRLSSLLLVVCNELILFNKSDIALPIIKHALMGERLKENLYSCAMRIVNESFPSFSLINRVGFEIIEKLINIIVELQDIDQKLDIFLRTLELMDRLNIIEKKNLVINQLLDWVSVLSPNKQQDLYYSLVTKIHVKDPELLRKLLVDLYEKNKNIKLSESQTIILSSVFSSLKLMDKERDCLQEYVNTLNFKQIHSSYDLTKIIQRYMQLLPEEEKKIYYEKVVNSLIHEKQLNFLLRLLSFMEFEVDSDIILKIQQVVNESNNPEDKHSDLLKLASYYLINGREKEVITILDELKVISSSVARESSKLHMMIDLAVVWKRMNNATLLEILKDGLYLISRSHDSNSLLTQFINSIQRNKLLEDNILIKYLLEFEKEEFIMVASNIAMKLNQKHSLKKVAGYIWKMDRFPIEFMNTLSYCYSEDVLLEAYMLRSKLLYNNVPIHSKDDI